MAVALAKLSMRIPLARMRHGAGEPAAAASAIFIQHARLTPSMQTHIPSRSAAFAGLAPAASVQQVPNMPHRIQLLLPPRGIKAASAALAQRQHGFWPPQRAACTAFTCSHAPLQVPSLTATRRCYARAAKHQALQHYSAPSSPRRYVLACSRRSTAAASPPRCMHSCTRGRTRLAAFALRAPARHTPPALLASRRLQPAATRRGTPTQSELAIVWHEHRASTARAQHPRIIRAPSDSAQVHSPAASMPQLRVHLPLPAARTRVFKR
jgi:hypothetical protein